MKWTWEELLQINKLSSRLQWRSRQQQIAMAAMLTCQWSKQQGALGQMQQQ